MVIFAILLINVILVTGQRASRDGGRTKWEEHSQKPINHPKSCGANESFRDGIKSCGGCDPTCRDPLPACSKICRVGCFCDPGYVRDGRGNCVSNATCSTASCKENEVYFDGITSCGSCDPTCDEQQDELCATVCRGGCFCDTGFVRDEDNNCVSNSTCKACGENASYRDGTTTCGGCDRTCDNLNPFCILLCQRGCFCDTGFVRDVNGTCVSEQTCLNATCGENEVFFNGVTSCGSCDPTCDGQEDELCATVCRGGCFCADGFVRDENDDCVSNSTCIDCGPNAVLTDGNPLCGYCDPTCDSPNIQCICSHPCHCLEGFVRDSDGNCVSNQTCSNTECPVNEIYADGITTCAGCNPTCANLDPICQDLCVPGCACASGYVEDSAGNCVSESTCA